MASRVYENAESFCYTLEENITLYWHTSDDTQYRNGTEHDVIDEVCHNLTNLLM